MKTDVMHRFRNLMDEQPSLPDAVRRWLLCISCFILLWAFMFVIAPWLQRVPMINQLAKYIEESGIEAGAIYYTEVKEVSEAEANMRDTLMYPPGVR
jgi:hypothetical protein